MRVACPNTDCINFDDTDIELYRLRHNYTLKDGRKAYTYFCRDCETNFTVHQEKETTSKKSKKYGSEQDVADINKLRKSMGLPLIQPKTYKCAVCGKDFTAMVKTPWCDFCKASHVKRLLGGVE